MATSNIEPLDNTNTSSSNIILNFDEDDHDFELVCLDVQIDDLDDNHDLEFNLKSHVNHICSFIDVHSCLEHMISHWFYRIYLIVSDLLASSILPRVEKMDHV